MPCVPDEAAPVHYGNRPLAALQPEAIQPIARERVAKKEAVQHVAYNVTNFYVIIRTTKNRFELL